MTLIFDKRQLSVSPALAPLLREAGEFDSRQNAEAVLNIGLINNMPDSALQATERQFMHLLKAAAGNQRVHLHCFSLPSVHRSQTAKCHIEKQYTDIADLDRLQLDGLIVTGAEPKATTLPEESFWQELIEIVDWAEANTRSTIWSCLAAHVAVLHLDGIERQRLDAKCSGVYDCAKVVDDWLTSDIPSPLKVSHSRLNGLRKRDLITRGYQILTQSQQAGVDTFAKQLRSYFVFFQGHPEYDTMSLQREYLRDVSRFLAGEQDAYPAVPTGYFEAETEDALASFQRRASAERKPALSAELPALTTRSDIATGAAAAVIFKNWLGYLSVGASTTLSSAARGARP
jgi:homoserine O-succinyltransferase/O-acetyltransferase